MDTNTVILTLAIGSFVFGTILILFQIGKDPSRRIPFWVSAKFLQGAGSLLLYISDTPPDSMTILFANSLLLTGCAYEGWAVFYITGRTVSRRLHVTATLSIVTVCIAMLFLNPPNRIAVHFLVHTIFYALPGWALLRNKGEKSPLRAGLGWSFSLLALIFAIRSAWALVAPEQSHLFFGVMIYQVMLPAIYCMMLISGFSMLLLAKEASDRELHEALLEQKMQRDMLSRQKEELEAANKSKTRFLDMVAHEFRTPLGLLATSTDILDRYWERLTQEERTEQNNRIRSAAQEIATLIKSVLSYNSEETDGSMVISPKLRDLGTLCRTIAGEAETVWSNGHTFEIAIADDCGTAMIDEHFFRRVLQNLLSNAFRYTPPEGTVSFLVRREGKSLIQEITDSGIGIAQEDQEHIFDAYYRGRNTGARRGLGLGLSIVQEAVELMGGSIAITSSMGNGTTIRLEIPLEDQES